MACCVTLKMQLFQIPLSWCDIRLVANPIPNYHTHHTGTRSPKLAVNQEPLPVFVPATTEMFKQPRQQQ